MEAMQKEIDDHTKGGHWKIMKQRYGAWNVKDAYPTGKCTSGKRASI
jgi:hypothetical protein